MRWAIGGTSSQSERIHIQHQIHVLQNSKRRILLQKMLWIVSMADVLSLSVRPFAVPAAGSSYVVGQDAASCLCVGCVFHGMDSGPMVIIHRIHQQLDWNDCRGGRACDSGVSKGIIHAIRSQWKRIGCGGKALLRDDEVDDRLWCVEEDRSRVKTWIIVNAWSVQQG